MSVAQHHSHNHAHKHSHGARKGRELALLFSVGLTGIFMLVEFIAGWWAGSRALMADAAHMLADAGALGLALFAVRLSSKHADDHRTFGYGRLQVLAAFINGLVALGLGSLLFTQAVRRFWRGSPEDFDSGLMLWVAVAGMFVNIIILFVLHRGDSRSVNIRGAMLHVLSDLLSSAAVIVAALAIQATGLKIFDIVATMLVSLLIIRSAKDILMESGHILLEGKPPTLKLDEVASAIKEAVPEVIELHHLHAWSLSGEDLIITLHARLVEGTSRSDDDILRAIKVVLHERFHIEHSTVQLERTACADAQIYTTVVAG